MPSISPETHEFLISPNDLCKCWKKLARNFDIFHIVGSMFTTAADFVPYLDQRSLFGTISFIKEFNFDLK